MRLAIAIEAPRVQRSGVFRGVLEGLPCDDDPAFLGVDHEGLMTGHVPRRRHDPDAGHDLRLAFEKLELRVAKVDDTFGHRVVGLPRGFVFDLLREDRHAGEAEVVARMIEVQVAVRDAAHILLLDAGLAQRRVELPPHRLVLRVDLGQAFPDAGVEEHRAARMEDEERVDDDGRTAEGQVRRRDEVTHVQADDVARAEDAHAVRRRGSSASRRESPNRLNPNTARLMATPGAIASQGARSRNCMPAPRSMRPHEGVGSNTPRPRNDREASRRIACPRNAVIMMTAFLGQAILLEASLSFLGLGVFEPTPSWGLMLRGAGMQFLERAPWLAIAPGVAISLAVFGFNLFGDSLRDALDPRLRTA